MESGPRATGEGTSSILIRGGLVYDGTGAPPKHLDIVVEGGRILSVTRSALTARLDSGPSGPPESPAPTEPRPIRELGPNSWVIDAINLAVAPGFIDIHTHSDLSVLFDGRAQSKVRQGVTTEVIGNCGFSAFPIAPERLRDHVDLLAGIGDDPLDPSWTDVDGYARVAAETGLAVNVAPLVGHGALRIAEMGLANRAPTEQELRGMRSRLDALLEQGAFGLSTGLTYVPSRYAETAELVALCQTLAARDRLYATHSRGDLAGLFDAVDESSALGRETGVAVQYSHVAINVPDRWGRAEEMVARFAAARQDGVDIAYDVYPYDASASALTQYLPPWVQEGGVEAMRNRLADPTVFRRAEEDLASGWGDPRIPWLWDRILLARTDDLFGTVDGQTLEEAAAQVGRSPAALVLDLCREGGNRVQVVLRYRTEEDMRTFLRYDHALIGSDGAAVPFDQQGRRPHPRAFGAHARVLGRHVRELADLDLATAIHRMTGAVADRLRLSDRGTIAAGQAADLVIFDPSSVADRATFLDPGQPPRGIHRVLVNGEIVVDADRQTDARPGQVLRAGQ
ncbi:D-aminoacylase [Actinopolymorpha pittospori]